MLLSNLSQVVDRTCRSESLTWSSSISWNRRVLNRPCSALTLVCVMVMGRLENALERHCTAVARKQVPFELVRPSLSRTSEPSASKGWVSILESICRGTTGDDLPESRILRRLLCQSE